MSAEVLRRAAALMWEREGRGDATEFHLAVADWLNYCAGGWENWRDGDVPDAHPALTVARAYLGEPS